MSDDYKVGYGKPPKHGQFKKGESGNPFLYLGKGFVPTPEDFTLCLVMCDVSVKSILLGTLCTLSLA